MTALTTTQAAEAAQVARSTILAAIENGRLPAVKHGRDWVIQSADLEKWKHNHNPRGGRPRKGDKTKETK